MTKENILVTYENNVFYCTKNGTKWISVDGEKWYGEEERIAELENKIADIKANCDLAIEGRDIKIKELELELTVEKDLHQEEIELHLHAEEYIKSLEQQIEKIKGCALFKTVQRDIHELLYYVEDNAENKVFRDSIKTAWCIED